MQISLVLDIRINTTRSLCTVNCQALLHAFRDQRMCSLPSLFAVAVVHPYKQAEGMCCICMVSLDIQCGELHVCVNTTQIKPSGRVQEHAQKRLEPADFFGPDPFSPFRSWSVS